MTFTEITFFMSESKEPVCGFDLPEQIRQFIAPAEAKDELYGRINEEKIKFYLK